MDTKQGLIAGLRAVFDGWEQFLAGRTDWEVTFHPLSTEWSVKDVIAHLMAWQQVSIARLQAALADAEPDFPAWLAGADPFFAEEHTADFNSRIHELYCEESWSSVYRLWREGFLHFLDLAEALPEEKILDAHRYAWLKGYALSTVLEGSREHHEEHLEASSAVLTRGKSIT